MPDITFSEASADDLDRIWRDTLLYSQRAAERIVEQLDHAASSLVLFPERGVRRNDLGPEFRALIIRRYLIIYLYEQPLDTVTILRILEGERDLTDLF